MDETASVAGGNFRAIRKTNEVVMAIRAKFAVEQFAGGDLEGLKELSRLGVYRTFIFLLAARTKRETLTSHTMTKSPSWISLFWDHIWRGGWESVSDYSTASEKEQVKLQSVSHVGKRREIRFPNRICAKSRLTKLFFIFAPERRKGKPFVSLPIAGCAISSR